MIRLILICLLYTIVSLNTSSEETKSIPKKKTKITWGKIPNAINYKIEIMDLNGEVKISEDTGLITFKEVILPAGVYKRRLIVKNKIGEEIVGKWSPLKIKAPTKNEIVYEDPKPASTTALPSTDIVAIEKPKPILEDRIYEKPKTRFDVLGRSMLLPGLGQYYYGTKLTNEKHHKIRGLIYMSLFTVASSFSFYSYMQNNHEKSEFEKDTQNRILISALIPRESSARNITVAYNFTETSEKYSDLKSGKENFNYSLSLMSVIYIVQLVDSIYLQNKIGHIRNILPNLEINIQKQVMNYHTVEENYTIGYKANF